MSLSRLAGLLPLSLLLVAGTLLSAQTSNQIESKLVTVPLGGITQPGVLDKMPSPPKGQSLTYQRPPLPDLPTVDAKVIPLGKPTPVPGALEPRAATVSVFKNSAVLPAGAGRSVIGEPSAIHHRFTAFYTGNWYAALSVNDGLSWSYINPYTKFPTVDGGFCCDQYTMFIPSYKMTLWLLQYAYSSRTQNGSQRIAVAKNESDLRRGIFHYYTFNPRTFGMGAGYKLDFPNLAYSNTYLYATSNIYKGSLYAGTVCWQMPLNKLASGAALPIRYIRRLGRTWRLSNGATTVMYWWQHVNNTRGTLFRWADGSTSIQTYTVTVPSWNWGNRGTMIAKDPSGRNWMARADSRPLAAWVSGGKVGVMWNAKQGGSFPYPYVRVIEISEATHKVVRSSDIWNSRLAFSYPSASKNARGHLGGSLAFGGGSYYPSGAAWIVDDLSPYFAPLNLATVAAGNNSPSSQAWGDYFTSIPHSRMTATWVATTMSMIGGSSGSNLVPRYVHFGRSRDHRTLADLVPTALSASSTVFYLGNAYTLRTTIRNEGTATVGTSNNGFYLSTNSVITTSDLLIRSFSLGSMSIGGSRSYAASVVIPNNAPLGNCWLGVYADRDRRIAEWSETNNTKALAVRCIGRPDLTITSVTSSASYLQAGGLVSIRATTKNIGRATSGISVTGMMLSTNSLITTFDDYLGGYSIPSLSPNASYTRSFIVRVPYFIPGSSRYLGAYADVGESIAEIFEGNNGRARIPALPVRSLSSGEYLQYRHPVFTNYNRQSGAYSLTNARLNASRGGTAPMYVVAPRRPGSWYLLIMSGRRPFVFDSFSSFGLGLLNTPMFPAWFTRTNSQGLGFPGLNLPRVHLTGPLNLYIYSAWFDPAFTTFQGFGINSLYLRVER